MKYFLSILVILIFASLAYKYLFAGKDPIAFTSARDKQANPFVTHKDSAAIMWARAKEYLKRQSGLISGGGLEENDTVLYIPYYNDHKKGNSIRIEQHLKGDSVSMFVMWWYNQKFSLISAKELALYMQKHVYRYDF